MRLSIEHGRDPILKGSFYVLKVGTRRYHYEKLADILYRIAVIFEPPEEEEKPKKKYTKKEGKLPLGDEIIKVLSSAKEWKSLNDIVKQIKTPKPVSRQVWSMVLANLYKSKKIKCVHVEGEDRYGI